MGVPKFFRYMSERYPCLSELLKEYQIPEFDNLYLDMNGIIHNCSHPDDGNPHFRITEEKIFSDIFHYIEVLFQMIKPHKLFFMAIDGVAPRAKMNQQRGRRFRSAKDAHKLEQEALKKGEELPTQARFDSNCITPGTEFMARLHEQLKYFVVKKVSQDPLWQRCCIILSGHETPGEGEHKIMDYIRYKRSQPEYDPNTRHCLYGLDADLIMLGLCTHEPHFSLLREEVKFGKKANKKTGVPEEIRFYLLHLSLMREYLAMEFASLKQTLKNFKFDIENIIDDWVLMGFLVGNDFIPNLPNLHITNGALPVLYKAYMEILPQLDGYINEGGFLNLKRFEIFMKKLGQIDVQNFEEVRDDLLYMEGKTGRKAQPFSKNNTKFRDLQAWKPESGEESLKQEFLEPLETEKASRDLGLSALIKATEEEYFYDENDSGSDCEHDDEEDEEFESYKRSYYINKLEYTKVTREVMRSQAEGYVRAIQWNLHYYYNGVCSWSWYYPHHYAPYISDIKNFQNMKLEYDFGKPFLPYEQLLAVLPAASKELLPECYQNLMTKDSSPIKRYYPEDFETDLNGKKQEWEAVVLVPFIDEVTLLEAMENCKNELSPSEWKRNKHGPMLSYTYTEKNLGVYESPMYFPNISNSHAKVQPIEIDEIRVPRNKLVKGAYPGVVLDAYYPGFPTFKHLDYQGHLKKSRVRVFEQPSRSENMIIQVIPSERVLDAKIPVELLGKIVHVGWPHLVEARIIEIFNAKEKYVFAGKGLQPILETSSPTFRQEVESVTEFYGSRLGIEFGKVLVLIKVQTMIGQQYMFTPDGRISLEKTFCENPSNYPLQLIVENVNAYVETREEFTTLESVFPAGSFCFSLTHNEYYGARATVQKDNKTPEGYVCVSVTCMNEPDLSRARHLKEKSGCRYITLYNAASQLGISNYVFSRITGSFFATARNREGGIKSVNLGLDLKFNKKNLETPGYTKKIASVWYYTDAAVDVVDAYAMKFPDVIEYIMNNNHNKDETSIEEIFPVDSDEKVKEVQTWLKAQPHSNVERRTCNSSVLEKEVVQEIEKIVDSYSSVKCENVVLHCKPNLLYKAELCFGNLVPDSTVEVQLFDRIVNVRSNHTVPCGLKGTVIGIHENASDSPKEYVYDILFDSIFEGGIEFSSSGERCYKLPPNAFIDISHGMRLYNPKISGQIATDYGQTRKEEYIHRKYQNYNHQNNRNSQNVTSPNSAFAKFSNQSFSNAPKSYNSVPPFMPNGEPIYKSTKSHNNRQNHSQQFQNNYINIKYEQAFDFRNPFPKNYASNSYPIQPTANLSDNYKQAKAGAVETVGHCKSDIKASNSQDKLDFMPTFNKVSEAIPKQHASNSYQASPRINIRDDNQFTRGVSASNKANKNKPPAVPYVPPQRRTSCEPNFSKGSRQSPTGETADALKRILKIGSAKNNDRENIEQPKQPNLLENYFGDKNISSVPSTVQLLVAFQSKGYGLPRYQYVSNEHGTQSQIKLPNRQIIIGRVAKTREQASEFVAEEALKVLNSKEEHPERDQEKPNKESPKKFPAPPKQWCNNEQRTEKSGPHQKNINKNSTKGNANNTWKGLIPLQVVKKEKANSTTNCPAVQDETNKKNSRTARTVKPENSAVEGDVTSKKKDPKPRKERKMRIAANFGLQE